jgi:UDP-perosamine 4-acetyltransferase
MDVVIVGAGGHGKVVLDILRTQGTYTPIGFLDADPSLMGRKIHGLPVLGQVNLLPRLKAQKVRAACIAIGDNRTRAQYARMLADHGFDLVNAIHPSAVVSPTAVLGTNVVIAAGAVVGTDANIGDNVIVNTGSIVDHECEVGESAHICPAAALAGRATVGMGAFIGLGARVIQCVTIGPHAIVGAGSVVLRDVPELATVVGVPARVIKVAAPLTAEIGVV